MIYLDSAALVKLVRVEATAAACVDRLLYSHDAVHLATADQLVVSGKDVGIRDL